MVHRDAGDGRLHGLGHFLKLGDGALIPLRGTLVVRLHVLQLGEGGESGRQGQACLEKHEAGRCVSFIFESKREGEEGGMEGREGGKGGRGK
jgi:hypothetical protein